MKKLQRKSTLLILITICASLLVSCGETATRTTQVPQSTYQMNTIL